MAIDLGRDEEAEVKRLPLLVFFMLTCGFLGAHLLFADLPPGRALLGMVSISILLLWVYGEALKCRDPAEGDRFLWQTFMPVGLLLLGFLLGSYWRWWR